jgi:hypothetical protein
MKEDATMNRMLLASLTALAVMGSASVPQAEAYCKFNFGVGMNIGMEAGGNSCLWGAFKSGPGPGAGFDGGDPSFGYAGLGGMPAMTGFADAGIPQFQPMPSVPGMAKPASTPVNPGVAQPVGYWQYQQPTYPQYQQPMYPQFYPQMNYGYYPAAYPYMWFGQ